MTGARGTADLLTKVNNLHPPQHKQAIEVELEQPEAEMEGTMGEKMRSCKWKRQRVRIEMMMTGTTIACR